MTALRVLCIDAEGGFGGSSRSLAALLTHVDRSRVAPTVWCRKAGPIQQTYADLGIPTRVVPDLPIAGSVERLSRNLASEALVRWRWAGAGATRRELIAAARASDVVHVNLESGWRVAEIVRAASDAAVTLHVRTNPISNAFARRQARRAAAAVHRFVFITENERSGFEALAGRSVPGDVVFNVVAPVDGDVAPRPDLVLEPRFKVACLANFDWSRGIDRLLEVARVLVDRGRRDIVFIVAGDMTLKGHLEGDFLAAKAAGKTLADIVHQRGLGDMFRFLGHVVDPERVLASVSALLKPTRLANPWGRDIIEALAQGVPVISIGTYDRFVKNGVSGILFADFDPAAHADALIALAEDPAEARRLGAGGKAIVTDLCDGAARARDMMDIWRRAVAERRR